MFRRIRKLRVLLILAAAVAVLTVQMPDKNFILQCLMLVRRRDIHQERQRRNIPCRRRKPGCKPRGQLQDYALPAVDRGGYLDYAIVTHTDKDHVSGLMELIEEGRVTVKHLILPKQTQGTGLMPSLRKWQGARK